jgi:quinohemoprotein ethanol dehydrogenase
MTGGGTARLDRRGGRDVARNYIVRLGVGSLAVIALGACLPAVSQTESLPSQSTARYLDTSEGKDWPGYGRTFGELHYSPLSEINPDSVRKLGLAWFLNLGRENSATQPIAVGGILYFATGHSHVHAVDAASGKLLWRYDPRAAEAAGPNLRLGWGSRGIAWWNDKIYTATQDGRLIAIDAKTGKPVWHVETFEKSSPRYISAAPRVFDGKVIIGHAGDFGIVRGYVTAYDAENGKMLWRFYTVPGNPADGFENDALKRAAKTWDGEWWKYGGGTVWNSIAYDPGADTVYFGTGNGYPFNARARSQGDNLFVCSIIAVDAKTGAYKWHYQLNPGDTWDYDATNDIQLAELDIENKLRKVLMIAPKNGFFYVIDRADGKLISAEPFAKVTWASHIDLKTGRPVENSEARYPNGMLATIWPSGMGAHGWLPEAYSPKTKLVYIPVIEFGMTMSDKGIDLRHWHDPADHSTGMAVDLRLDAKDPQQGTGSLLAWDPQKQKAVWQVQHPTYANGGVMATGGNLVFQGTVDGKFSAYAAETGRLLWAFDAQAPMIGPPISYSVNGKQYITVLTGLGTTIGIMGPLLEHYGIDPRTQARRVLTFAIDAKAELPAKPSATLATVDDPNLRSDPRSAEAGQAIYNRRCVSCHGISVVSGTHAPDLRRSSVPLSREAFVAVVRDGAIVAGGMPRFKELTAKDCDDLRQYIRTEARKGSRKAEGATSPKIESSRVLQIERDK